MRASREDVPFLRKNPKYKVHASGFMIILHPTIYCIKGQLLKVIDYYYLFWTFCLSAIMLDKAVVKMRRANYASYSVIDL